MTQNNLQLGGCEESPRASVFSKAKTHVLRGRRNELSHAFFVHRSLTKLQEPVRVKCFGVWVDGGIPHLAARDQYDVPLWDDDPVG